MAGCGGQWQTVDQVVGLLNLDVDPRDLDAVVSRLKESLALVHPDQAMNGGDARLLKTLKGALDFVKACQGSTGEEGRLPAIADQPITEMEATPRPPVSGAAAALGHARMQRNAEHQAQVSRRVQEKRRPINYVGLSTVVAGVVALPSNLQSYPLLQLVDKGLLLVFWVLTLIALGARWAFLSLAARNTSRIIDRLFDPVLQDMALTDLLTAQAEGHAFLDPGWNGYQPSQVASDNKRRVGTFAERNLRGALWYHALAPWQRKTFFYRFISVRQGDTPGGVDWYPLDPLPGLSVHSLPDGTLEDATLSALDRWLETGHVERVGATRFPAVYRVVEATDISLMGAAPGADPPITDHADEASAGAVVEK